MREISFTIDHAPVAKGRPKFARRGKFVTTYTPKKTVDFESVVAETAKLAMGSKEPMNRPLRVEVSMCFPIPASISKKAKDDILNGYTRHTKRPDVDNAAKAVLDALNGIVWIDDSQIVRLIAEKHYSGWPRIEVNVREIA